MADLWKIRCSDGAKPLWERSVTLPESDVVPLLRMLLCRNLAEHEIFDSVEGQRDLLAVSREGEGFHTLHGLLHYTALPEEAD